MTDTKTEAMRDVLSSLDRSQEEGARMMEKIFAAAQPGAVYTEPIVSGSYTIILASEVMSGGGFGFGKGVGPGPSAPTPTGEVQPSGGERIAGGEGGGGGGGSSARPVAAIVVGPNGVKIEPVLDITKVALAGIAAWGTVVAILTRMRKASKG